MSMAVDCVTVACNTSTAAQAISVDVGGLTPKLALFCVTMATADDTATDEASLCWGWTDGTNEFCCVMAAEHNTNPRTDTYCEFVSDECVQILDPNTGAIDGEANISSFATDQVNINWGNLPAGAYRLTVWVLAGADIECAVINATLDQTQDTEKSIVHGLSSVPTWMAAGAVKSGSSFQDSGIVAGARMSTGYASYDGTTIDQACGGAYWGDNLAGRDTMAAAAYNRRIVKLPYLATGPAAEPAETAAEITTVDGTKVGITKRDALTDLDLGLVVVAGNFAHVAMWDAHEGTPGFPTGTGVKTHDPSPSTDFHVRGALLVLTRLNYSELNGIAQNVRAGTFGHGLIGGEDYGSAPGESSQTAQFQRNSFPTDAQSFTNQKALHLPAHTGGTGGHEGAFDSYGQTEVSIDVTNGVSSTKCIPVLILGYPRISPTGLNAAVALGQPTPKVKVLPTGLNAAVALGQPTPKVKVSPTGLDTAVALGQPTLSLFARPTGLAVPMAFGSPTSTLVIGPTGLEVAPAFGSPTLSTTKTINATGLDLNVGFGSPTLSTTRTINATGLNLNVAFGSPTLSITNTINVTGLNLNVGFGSRALSVNLTAPLNLGRTRGVVRVSGPVAGRVVASVPSVGLLAVSGPSAGRVVASLGRGLVVVSGATGGRVVAPVAPRGIIATSGPKAGRIVSSQLAAGRVTLSGVAAGRVVSSGAPRGIVAVSGVKAGRIVSNA